MEFKTLDEHLEWERKRVAAAFAVKEWETYFGGSNDDGEVIWDFDSENKRLWMVDVGEPTEDNWMGCKVFRLSNERWEARMFQALCQHKACMTRGIYRLGIEDEAVLAELNHPLSAHEKLELRLSMPREFWPQKWLEEEEAQATST